MAERPAEVHLIAPDSLPEAGEVGDWLDSQGVAHIRVTSVPGTPLVVRVDGLTLSGPAGDILRRLQDILWRDLQT
jgi:hypothetical protein